MKPTSGIRILCAVENREKWRHIKELLEQEQSIELWDDTDTVERFLQKCGMSEDAVKKTLPECEIHADTAEDFLPESEMGAEAIFLDAPSFTLLCRRFWEQAKEEADSEVELLRQLTWRDEMTGLYNRKYCMNALEALLKENQGFTLCFIDADKLKTVNDLFGHINGDRFILHVAQALCREMKGRGSVCRIYGDEFVILLPGVCREAAGQMIEEAQKALLEEEKLFPFRMTISYGLCEYDGKETVKAQELLNQAERQMYEQKAAKGETDVRRKK